VKLKLSLLVVNVKENYTTASTEGHRLGHCDCWPDGYYIEIEDDSPTDRIRHLEDALKEIRDIAHVSEGAEFYAMVADKALKGAK
jgi:hypothetical protein